jgi:hypothetical protein
MFALSAVRNERRRKRAEEAGRLRRFPQSGAHMGANNKGASPEQVCGDPQIIRAITPRRKYPSIAGESQQFNDKTGSPFGVEKYSRFPGVEER